MKVSDLVVKCLEAEGVRYVFGLPGESSIKFIPTRQELSLVEIPIDPAVNYELSKKLESNLCERFEFS